MMAMPSFQVYTVKSLFKNALECSFSYVNVRFRLNADYVNYYKKMHTVQLNNSKYHRAVYFCSKWPLVTIPVILRSYLYGSVKVMV
jgi:hypothetical protein